MRMTVERLRWLLLIGGGLLVAAIAIFLAAGQWKLLKSFKDVPGRLGIDIEQSADGVNYTQTRKGKTIFRIHAAKAVTRKTGGTTALHDVTIDLYGEDGNRADTITGSEFEYDPKAGLATAAGAVEILMMRPGVKPAITALRPDSEKMGALRLAPEKAGLAKGARSGKVAGGLSLAASPVLGAITDNEIHIETSGLTFNQKTGVATTAERVDFALRQGSGSSMGATYDSPNGHLILNRAVELIAERNGGGPVKVHSSHAEFVHDAMECRLAQAHAEYTGGAVQAAEALIHFREDGSVTRVDGSDGVDLRTLAGSHMTAPTGSLEFDAANHPQRGLLSGGTRLEMDEPNRQVRGTAPTARLTFDTQGLLSLAHMEQGVVFNSQQQVTTAKGEDAEVRRTWNSQTADVAFAPVAAVSKPANAGAVAAGHVEPRTIHGFGGVVISSQTVTGGVAMPSRLAADTVVAELAPGGGLSTLHGVGHASFDERNARGVHQATSADVLDVRFVQQPKGAAPPGTRSKDTAGGSEIASVVEVGHVVLVQDAAPTQKPQTATKASAPGGFRATADRSDYDGATELLHLTGSPRVQDGAMDMTAKSIDFARVTGDALAHGDVRASWTGNGPGTGASGGGVMPGASLLAGGASGQDGAGPGGNGPIHAIAAEAELRQATQEVVFRSSGKAGSARLWQSVNSVAAPVIVLNRLKQTLDAEANGAAEPVRTVLVSNGGLSAGNAGAAKGEASSAVRGARPRSPSTIRVRSGELHYSEAERVALFHSGAVGQVTAETADAGGTATIASRKAEVTLFPAGVHGGPATGAQERASPNSPSNASPNAAIDRLTALGHVSIDWPGRQGTGEKLVYRSEDGNYTLTGSSSAPPRIVDEGQGMVTGSALILHSGDNKVTVEGDGGKTVTETRSKK